MRYWLFKSEPDCFSIKDLAAAPRQTTYWDGVRNYQARNLLRDTMQVGDLGLFYHSSCEPPGVAGLVEVVAAGYPDFTAWDPNSQHPDPKSTPEQPVWYMVDLRLREVFASFLPLEALRGEPKLAGMELLKRGSRLSVQPVEAPHFELILKLANAQFSANAAASDSGRKATRATKTASPVAKSPTRPAKRAGRKP